MMWQRRGTGLAPAPPRLRGAGLTVPGHVSQHRQLVGVLFGSSCWYLYCLGWQFLLVLVLSGLAAPVRILAGFGVEIGDDCFPP